MVLENSISSISEGLLKKSINYARTFVDISSGKEKTIMHCRKSLLFNNSDIWIKKRAARILMLLWVALTAQKFATWLMFVFYIY